MATPLIDNVTLTETPDDNMQELAVENSKGINLHVSYTKGTENHMHVLLQFSTIKDDDGVEVWSDWSDINQVSGPDKHLIENDSFRIEATGNYRFPYIPISPREDKIRVKVFGNGASTGTVSVYAVTDKYVV